MKKIQEIRNDTARLIEHPHHVNCIRLHSSTTREHRQRIFEICNALIEEGMEFMTEAKFKPYLGSGRADIVVLDLGIAIEVKCKEDQKSIESKRRRYPIPVIVSEVEKPFILKQLL